MPIIDESNGHLRLRELAMMEKKELEEREKAKKNKKFTQVYPLGWGKLREIIKHNPQAANLYSFFAEHIDPTCGAVICDQQFLANEMKVSIRTIQRWLKYLESEKVLVKIPIAGKVCAYALNPYEVWKGYNSAKQYAMFITRTLVNKDQEIKRRIMSMFSSEIDSENKQ